MDRLTAGSGLEPEDRGELRDEQLYINEAIYNSGEGGRTCMDDDSYIGFT